MSVVLELDNVSLQYGALEVVRHLSLQVDAGEFFVIIGPNGAGKTTLLKAIAGLHPVTTGDILAQNRPVGTYSRKELARFLALVPQQVNAEFPFTVAETVLMGRYPHLGLLALEGRRDLEQAEHAMAFTEVLHLADRRIGQLSGGERQRVIIARAICQQPQVLLLDEPTAALDPAHQLRIMDLMERLRQQEKMTVVMVSHDLNLASLYADRMMLLKAGELAKIGSPQEVLTREVLTRSYGCNMFVDRNPVSSTPRVSLVAEKTLAPPGCGE